MDITEERIAGDLGVLSPVVVRERRGEVRAAIRARRWQQVGRCAVMHNGPLTGDQLMWCAVLSPPDLAALARDSALRAAGVRGLAAGPLIVVTRHGRRPVPIPGVAYVQSRHLGGDDLVPYGRPLRTTAARAVVDAASRASADRARMLVAMVVQQKRATPAQVRAVLTRLTPVRRESLLRVTLADVEGGSHSLPELRFLSLVRCANLPMPTRQVRRQRPDGRWYLDVGWEAYGLLGEIDGTHHRDAAQWEADTLRAAELLIGGDRVLRLLSWWVRDRPELVIDLVRRALVSCGWRP